MQTHFEYTSAAKALLSLIEKAADVTFAKSNGVLQAAATYSGHPTSVYAVKIDVCLEVPMAMENGIGLAASRLQAFVNSVNGSLGRDTAELWLSSDNDVGRRDVTLCLRPDRIAEVGRLML